MHSIQPHGIDPIIPLQFLMFDSSLAIQFVFHSYWSIMCLVSLVTPASLAILASLVTQVSLSSASLDGLVLFLLL